MDVPHPIEAQNNPIGKEADMKDVIVSEDIDSSEKNEQNSPNDDDNLRSKNLQADDTTINTVLLNEGTNKNQPSSSHDLETAQIPGKTEDPIISPNIHPYQEKLLNFEPPSDQLSLLSHIEPCKPLQQTPLYEITTKENLEKLINDLKEEKEFGIDVEFSDHGYEGVTCLVQISTKQNDYIIDTIELKDQMHLLNDILINPKIVKIFHAAQNDLKWLQQDFRLFVINMFDTQKAMKALNYERLGLDSILSDYKVKKDKKMQRVDFRRRPLPPEYKEYARTDSHFLIHIYHTLKNKLIEAQLLQQVLEECKKECLIVHNDKSQDSTYLSVQNDIITRHQQQLVALEKLNQWRNKLAKDLNINTGHILSKNNLKALCLQTPVDPGTIKNIGRSKYVEKNVQEIVKIMEEAIGRLKPEGSEEKVTGTNRTIGYKHKADSEADETRANKRQKNYHGYGNRGGRSRGAHFRQHRGNNRGFYHR